MSIDDDKSFNVMRVPAFWVQEIETPSRLCDRHCADMLRGEFKFFSIFYLPFDRLIEFLHMNRDEQRAGAPNERPYSKSLPSTRRNFYSFILFNNPV